MVGCILLCRNEWDFSDELLSISCSDEAAAVLSVSTTDFFNWAFACKDLRLMV